MKRIIYLLFLIALLDGTVVAQSEDFSKLRRMFLYDRKMPLDVREIGVENRDGIQVHDISYVSPKGGRVTAYLVIYIVAIILAGTTGKIHHVACRASIHPATHPPTSNHSRPQRENAGRLTSEFRWRGR